MKQLTDRLANLMIALLASGTVALSVGVAPKLVGILAFAALDLAGIIWASENSDKGLGHRESRRRQHQQVVARAST